jgi:hypothetical protein
MSAPTLAHPWGVWHIPECGYTGDRHGKFVVAAYLREDGERFCFFINSKMDIHPARRDCHVFISLGIYQFLPNHCYTACFRMYAFPAARFARENYRGELTREMSLAVQKTACACPMLAIEHKKNLGCPPHSFPRR